MLPELNACEEAEDFFQALGVPFEPRVLEAHRLPILRRFGDALLALADRHPGERDDILRGFVRAALREAYASERDGVPPAQARAQKSCGGCALAPACDTAATG
jgi:nitrogenase-stabilizing/protective protein